MKYLITLMFSLPVMANYIPGSFVGVKDVSYLRKSSCESRHKEECYLRDKDYKHEYARLEAVLFDGKPRFILGEDEAKKKAYEDKILEKLAKKDKVKKLKLSELNQAKKDKLLLLLFREYLERKGLGPDEL